MPEKGIITKLIKVKKELHLKLSEALTLGDEDIKENWKIYQKAFSRGGRINEVYSLPPEGCF